MVKIKVFYKWGVGSTCTVSTENYLVSSYRTLKMGQFLRHNTVGPNQWRRQGVDCGGHVHATFARNCAWDWWKSGEFLRRAG